MHVYITGIAGFLGANLADYYLKKGFKVSGNDNLIGGDIENINTKKINFYKIDCENLEDLTQSMKGVDVVCHAAAYAHEGLSSFSPTLICTNNITGSTAVFTAAIRNKVKELFFVLLWPDMEAYLLHIKKQIYLIQWTHMEYLN